MPKSAQKFPWATAAAGAGMGAAYAWTDIGHTITGILANFVSGSIVEIFRKVADLTIYAKFGVAAGVGTLFLVFAACMALGGWRIWRHEGKIGNILLGAGIIALPVMSFFASIIFPHSVMPAIALFVALGKIATCMLGVAFVTHKLGPKRTARFSGSGKFASVGAAAVGAGTAQLPQNHTRVGKYARDMGEIGGCVGFGGGILLTWQTAAAIMTKVGVVGLALAPATVALPVAVLASIALAASVISVFSHFKLTGTLGSSIAIDAFGFVFSAIALMGVLFPVVGASVVAQVFACAAGGRIVGRFLGRLMGVQADHKAGGKAPKAPAARKPSAARLKS